MKDQERVHQIIEAEPLIHSATEKIHHNVAISKSRLKESRREKEELYLKGKEMNFNHFVQVENGQSLHYYKIAEEGQAGVDS
jgi:hypothetical protein